MERFRKYIGGELFLDKVKNAGRLEEYGIVCTYLPDPPEEFDELEFRTGHGGLDNIVITVTLERGKIKRLMFSEADRQNPDIVRSLGESKLAAFLTEKGGQMADFLKYITCN